MGWRPLTFFRKSTILKQTFAKFYVNFRRNDQTDRSLHASPILTIASSDREIGHMNYYKTIVKFGKFTQKVHTNDLPSKEHRKCKLFQYKQRQK